MTAIEWTDQTWNPVTGCTRVSPGCAHCYALELAPRLRAMGVPRYVEANDGGKGSGPAFGVTLHEDVLSAPLRWRKPRRVFVNSMSDLFHEDIPFDFIDEVFRTMALTQRHTYQVLTKRPERMREYLADRRWRNFGYSQNEGADMWFPIIPGEHREGDDVLPNVWLGVSIENRRFVGRADVLKATPAAVRFISAEPLLGPLVGRWVEEMGDYGASHGWEHVWPDGSTELDPLDLTGIDWLIVGGESGPEHRPMKLEWVRDLRDACLSQYAGPCSCGTWPTPADAREGRCRLCGDATPLLGGHGRTAFFFKQVGGRTPKAGGRLLDGRTWDEMPEVARA